MKIKKIKERFEDLRSTLEESLIDAEESMMIRLQSDDLCQFYVDVEETINKMHLIVGKIRILDKLLTDIDNGVFKDQEY